MYRKSNKIFIIHPLYIDIGGTIVPELIFRSDIFFFVFFSEFTIYHNYPSDPYADRDKKRATHDVAACI